MDHLDSYPRSNLFKSGSFTATAAPTQTLPSKPAQCLKSRRRRDGIPVGESHDNWQSPKTGNPESACTGAASTREIIPATREMNPALYTARLVDGGGAAVARGGPPRHRGEKQEGAKSHRCPSLHGGVKRRWCNRCLQRGSWLRRWAGRYKATWKSGIQPPMAHGRSTTIISMIQWTRTRRLSIKISLSLAAACSRRCSSENHLQL